MFSIGHKIEITQNLHSCIVQRINRSLKTNSFVLYEKCSYLVLMKIICYYSNVVENLRLNNKIEHYQYCHLEHEENFDEIDVYVFIFFCFVSSIYLIDRLINENPIISLNIITKHNNYIQKLHSNENIWHKILCFVRQ